MSLLESTINLTALIILIRRQIQQHHSHVGFLALFVRGAKLKQVGGRYVTGNHSVSLHHSSYFKCKTTTPERSTTPPHQEQN